MLMRLMNNIAAHYTVLCWHLCYTDIDTHTQQKEDLVCLLLSYQQYYAVV